MNGNNGSVRQLNNNSVNRVVAPKRAKDDLKGREPKTDSTSATTKATSLLMVGAVIAQVGFGAIAGGCSKKTSSDEADAGDGACPPCPPCDTEKASGDSDSAQGAGSDSALGLDTDTNTWIRIDGGQQPGTDQQPGDSEAQGVDGGKAGDGGPIPDLNEGTDTNAQGNTGGDSDSQPQETPTDGTPTDEVPGGSDSEQGDGSDSSQTPDRPDTRSPVQTDTGSSGQTDGEGDSDTKEEGDGGDAADVDTDTDKDSESGSANADTDSDTEIDTDTDKDSDTGSASNVDTDADSDTGTKVDTDTDADSESGSATDADSDIETGSASDIGSDSESDSEGGSDTGISSDTVVPSTDSTYDPCNATHLEPGFPLDLGGGITEEVHNDQGSADQYADDGNAENGTTSYSTNATPEVGSDFHYDGTMMTWAGRFTEPLQGGGSREKVVIGHKAMEIGTMNQGDTVDLGDGVSVKYEGTWNVGGVAQSMLTFTDSVGTQQVLMVANNVPVDITLVGNTNTNTYSFQLGNVSTGGGYSIVEVMGYGSLFELIHDQPVIERVNGQVAGGNGNTKVSINPDGFEVTTYPGC